MSNRNAPFARLRLYAPGLGLMLFSPCAAAGLPEGADCMIPGAELGEPLRALAAEQRVVLLGSGSPELDYELSLYRRAPSDQERSAALAGVIFGLHVAGGELAVRDGYAPMSWCVADEFEQRAALEDGYYRVEACWLPAAGEAMHIALFFLPSGDLVPGDGWPYLPYRARMADEKGR